MGTETPIRAPSPGVQRRTPGEERRPPGRRARLVTPGVVVARAVNILN